MFVIMIFPLGVPSNLSTELMTLRLTKDLDVYQCHRITYVNAYTGKLSPCLSYMMLSTFDRSVE